MTRSLTTLLGLTLLLLGLSLGLHVAQVSAQAPATPHWLQLVNAARGAAGVPPVAADATLSAQCWEHARYMAENNHITHAQNPSLPFASPGGDHCAHHGNVWLGPPYLQPVWTEERAIADWLASPGHRLWLLYPTTPAFGFGFYTAASNSASAALDVSSRANFAADRSYPGWPVRYPAAGKTDVPAGRYPITLNWRYLGPAPTISQVQLTVDGRPVAHMVTTDLPARHKGVLITPAEDITPCTTITVTVIGVYGGTAFNQTWSYATRP